MRHRWMTAALIRDLSAIDVVDARVALLAGAQGGVISRTQAAVLGASAGAIRSRLERSAWQPVHHGVYAVGHAALGLRGRCIAALLAAGPDAAIGHDTAGVVYEIHHDDLEVIHLTCPRLIRRPGMACHQDALTDVRTIDGIPVTGPRATLVGMARTAGRAKTVAAIREARLKRLVTEQELRSVPSLKALSLSPTAKRTRSQLERDLLTLIKEAGLPLPRSHVQIHGYEADLAWHSHRLIVEVDTHHTHADRFHADRRRDAALTANGWRVVRLTDHDIEHETLRAIATIATLLIRVLPAA